MKTCHHLETLRSVYPVYCGECVTVGEDGKTVVPNEGVPLLRRNEVARSLDDARAALLTDCVLARHLLSRADATAFYAAVDKVYEASRPERPPQIGEVSAIGESAVDQIAKLI